MIKHYQPISSSFFSLEIPVFPTVTATVTFQSFGWKEDVNPNIFTIPVHYREDPKRFPDL